MNAIKIISLKEENKFPTMDPRLILHKNNLIPKKSFGQNFLIDSLLLDRISEHIYSLSKKSHSASVFELGSGTGALTECLLKKKLTLQTIERDRDMVPILNEAFHSSIKSGQLKLHEDDIVKFLKKLHHFKKKVILCGNLPFNLSSAILFQTADLYKNLSGAIYLLQKEFVERINSTPCSKSYGVLSVLVQSRYKISILENVDRTCFWPSPIVESNLICLNEKKNEQIDWNLFVNLVKTAFSKRRKTLLNNLKNYPDIDIIFEVLKIKSNSRAEEISFETYHSICNKLKR